MDDIAEVEERIVMEPGSADRLSLLENAAQLADDAMIPPSVPETDAVADRLMACLGKSASIIEAIQLERPRRLPSTAVLASVGLILTAGVTLVGLRRRGLV